MRRSLAVFFLLPLLALWAPGMAHAQPNRVTLQGVLRTADGGVVSGDYAMSFRFYPGKTADEPVFTYMNNQVPVAAGVYSVVVDFGQQEVAALSDSLWLGITVEDQEEYPRVPLNSVLYARRAAVADALGCTGCVSAEMLGLDPLTQEKLAQGDLAVGGTVTAAAFVGDGSGLTGISSPQGSCAPDWFVAGIDPDGTLQCQPVPPTVTSVDGLAGGTVTGDVAINGALMVNDFEVCTQQGNCGETLAQLTCAQGEVARYNGDMWECAGLDGLFDPAMLPADALNEVSNDLLTNQFVDTWASATVPVPIPDNNPTGISDEIVVPDVGLAQGLTVTIDIENSDLTTLKVVLFDPQNQAFVLYDKGGEGTHLEGTFPAPDAPVSGDLTAWIGQNPAGTWRLQAFDTGFLDNTTDGQISAWSIQVQTLSSQKVEVQGDLVVAGNIVSAGGTGLTIDENGNSAFSGHVVIGSDDGVCTPEIRGALRYDAAYGLEACNGEHWLAAHPRPVVWSGYCANHGTANEWNQYCLSNVTFNTAQKYVNIENNMVRFLLPGYYRIDFWTISNGGGTAHIEMFRRLTNNSDERVHYSHEYTYNDWDDNTATTVQPFQADEKFWLQIYNPSGGNQYAYHKAYGDGRYGKLTVTFLGPLEP